MECPNCSNQMQEINKYGVEIDYCSRCKGVWLDRGEIEKITDSQDRYQANYDKNYSNEDGNYGYRDRNGYDDGYHKYNANHKKRRGGFLEDLFDFG